MSSSVEKILEAIPSRLKRRYGSAIRLFRAALKTSGLLEHLDVRAKINPRWHYWRSLLAIYQLEDMIALDVPWWTYPAIRQIEHYLNSLDSKPTIFEYGSGASTVWLAKWASKLISVEHNKEWFDKLAAILPNYPQVELLWRPPLSIVGPRACYSAKESGDFAEYVNTITLTDLKFDLIVIDGRSRSACLAACLPFLKPSGLIIFDNSNRSRYQAALQPPDFSLERLPGRVPGSPFKSETALLHKIVLAPSSDYSM